MKIPRRLILMLVFLLTVIIGVDVAFLVGLNAPDTGVSYPLMHDGGGGGTEVGDLRGQILISEGDPLQSSWFLTIENWSILVPYSEPFISFNRADASHERVKWNQLDGQFIVVDEGTFVPIRDGGAGTYPDAVAALIYTVDGKDYIRWADRAVRTGCYGGAKIWYFDRPVEE